MTWFENGPQNKFIYSLQRSESSITDQFCLNVCFIIAARIEFKVMFRLLVILLNCTQKKNDVNVHQI